MKLEMIKGLAILKATTKKERKREVDDVLPRQKPSHKRGDSRGSAGARSTGKKNVQTLEGVARKAPWQARLHEDIRKAMFVWLW